MAAEKVNPWMLAQPNLRSILDEHSYKNWFSPTRFASCENGELVVNVPSEFFANWLRDHYMDAISASLREVMTDFQEVRFVATNDAAPARGESAEITTIASQIADATIKKTNDQRASKFPFNRRYSFDRFVIGAGNRFSHAAAKAVVENPARAYNPLFMYGKTGMGKTHLMQAIGQELLTRRPDASVVFISCEQFTNELIEAIQRKATPRFRARYRKVDVLLIDDVQFLEGKDATQEEFFHTFNELFDRHKQIVLSSDRPPKEMVKIEERLVGRFEWGLVTDIQPPDFETRIAILQNKAAEENLEIEPEVARYIATYVTSNVRELEGALITIVAYSKLTQQEISNELVEQVLHDLIGAAKIKSVTVEGIQRAVAEFFDVRIADMRSRNRQRQVAYPRQVGMYLCKELIPSLTLAEIGEAFGGKDHTTVLYARQKITDEIQTKDTTKQLIGKLQKTIQN